MAGTVADRFEKAALRVDERAGTRRSPPARRRRAESTVERTTEDANQRLAEQLPAGQTEGAQVPWPWHQDFKGRSCAILERDATGVRQQGQGGGAAVGRLADVGRVGNPTPAWSWPEEKRTPRPARTVAGLYPREAPAVTVGRGYVARRRRWGWIRRTAGWG